MIALTPAEIAILWPEYKKYCASHQRWHYKNGDVMSFNDWWRDAADEAKDRAKYKD